MASPVLIVRYDVVHVAGSYTGSSPISAAAWQPHNYPPLGGLQVDGSYPSSIGNTLHYQPPCARIPPYSTFSMAATLPPPPQYSEVCIAELCTCTYLGEILWRSD